MSGSRSFGHLKHLMKFLRTIFCVIPCLVWVGGDVAWAQPSIARRWNEQNLNAIRGDSPHPPVHARNLFHLSVAMYDAWAAYDPSASGYVYREKHTAADVASARREAISYAAYRLLLERYSLSRTAGATLIALSAHMASLGYDRNNLSLDPSEPAGVGNAVAAQVSSHFLEDGVRQAQGYLDVPANRGGYAPMNPPLVTASSGAIVVDVNRWQPLAIDNALDQNGFPIGPVQVFQGSQCLNVWSFALTRSDSAKPWIDPGPPPRLGGNEDARFREEVVDVIRRSSHMSPDDGVFLDISPGKYGNNTLGANDGVGHAINPATGLPYPANRVKRADFVRVLAEFWADGPHSETPPGHWNVIANAVSDHARSSKRIGGTGPVLDALEWDVKLYFALNAALHDAACAAWSLKRHYDGGRPIQFIRYMGQLGQSTRTNDASYHPLGLPLIPGLIEEVNPFTAQRGGRHAGLAPGSIAVLAWPGQPLDITNHYSGVRWVAAADWIPYQKKTFVTPAFPGYISGHSTFSRAGAELLAAFTGSPFFPMASASTPSRRTPGSPLKKVPPSLSPCSGAPTSMQPIRRESPGCGAVFTCPPMTSTAGVWVRSVVGAPGIWRANSLTARSRFRSREAVLPQRAGCPPRHTVRRGRKSPEGRRIEVRLPGPAREIRSPHPSVPFVAPRVAAFSARSGPIGFQSADFISQPSLAHVSDCSPTFE
jgi:hypothetical protein